MPAPFVPIENVDQRVLAAIRFVHAVTDQPVRDSVQLDSPGTTWVRNRDDHYVLLEAPGLEAHAGSFEVPSTSVPHPALASVSVKIQIHDPAGRYLRRSVTIHLPRRAALADAAKDDSVFQPVSVRLFPAPVARAAPGWAVIRGCVLPKGKPQACKNRSGLAGALILVRDAAGAVRGRGLSDAYGEVFLGVSGIPVRNWPDVDDAAAGGAANPVVVPDLDVRIEILHDEATTGPPDPDDLETRAKHDARLLIRTHDVKLASGREQATTL